MLVLEYKQKQKLNYLICILVQASLFCSRLSASDLKKNHTGKFLTKGQQIATQF